MRELSLHGIFEALKLVDPRSLVSLCAVGFILWILGSKLGWERDLYIDYMLIVSLLSPEIIKPGEAKFVSLDF